MATNDSTSKKKTKTVSKERQFKGLSLSERKEARREKLIEAGIATYGTLGFFSVTVKDVCQEAKLTERYFYESFKKSEDLFQTIFLKMIEELQQNLMQAVIKAAGVTTITHTNGKTIKIKNACIQAVGAPSWCDCVPFV